MMPSPGCGIVEASGLADFVTPRPYREQMPDADGGRG
jgi:hypothetical protein